jgi:mannose/cellobiose epimerase-like protein (N-acyl-D-glucosamine 2-epimerase family)
MENWLENEGHFRWLRAEQDRLVRFHEATALRDDLGVAFAPLGLRGEPDVNAPRELYLTGRAVHCFAIEHLLGRPGADLIATRGVNALLEHFLDGERGGFINEVYPDGQPADTTKPAYGNAFALLAGATALIAELPRARELLEQASAALSDHFWVEADGAAVDAMTADWQEVDPTYRGQNANMHLTEAYLSAFDATGDVEYQRRAEAIAALLINNHARAHGWRVVEHFDPTWQAVPDFNIENKADPFRPYGVTPGHALEWARLLLQLNALPGSRTPWALEAAVGLFATAMRDVGKAAFDRDGAGIPYTTDFDGHPVAQARMWWVMAEAVGAATYLYHNTDDASYAGAYQRFWSHIREHFIDYDGGSWWHELSPEGHPAFHTWPTKPDLYHAYQATLFARATANEGLALAASHGLIR